MKLEYREGQKSKKDFEQAMKALFQAPTMASKKKRAKTQPATLRKSNDSDKG